MRMIFFKLMKLMKAILAKSMEDQGQRNLDTKGVYFTL